MKHVFFLALLTGLAACTSYLPAVGSPLQSPLPSRLPDTVLLAHPPVVADSVLTTKPDTVSQRNAVSPNLAKTGNSQAGQLEPPKGKFGGDSLRNVAGRLIALNVEVYLRSSRSDTLPSSLTALTQRYGGFILGTGEQGYQLKVPQVALRWVLDALTRGKGGAWQSTLGKDLTPEVDLCSRQLANAEKAHQRYAVWLEEAENAEEALKIEKELERLSNEVDSLQTRLQTLNYELHYATVQVMVQTKKKTSR